MGNTDRRLAAFRSIPSDWAHALGSASSADRLHDIAEFVANAREVETVLPDADRVFAALNATPFESVRAVILGQDPYPRKTHAMGLAFSVRRELPPPFPRSLQNIRSELRSDGGWAVPDHGSLEAWSRRGVLLLNTTLTVAEGRPGSHRQARWWVLTDAIISVVAAKQSPVAFLLWGRQAHAKARLIDESRHVVIRSAHPSPLSQAAFLGTRPFSRANVGLERHCAARIDWNLSD